MVPKNKLDLVAIEKLNVAGDKEVLNNISILLEWLQDCNWPVFDGVLERLARLNFELEPYIFKILENDDCIWKANIVGHLIPKLSNDAQARYNDKLSSMLQNASQVDYEEGLVDFIEMQLERMRKNT